MLLAFTATALSTEYDTNFQGNWDHSYASTSRTTDASTDSYWTLRLASYKDSKLAKLFKLRHEVSRSIKWGKNTNGDVIENSYDEDDTWSTKFWTVNPYLGFTTSTLFPLWHEGYTKETIGAYYSSPEDKLKLKFGGSLVQRMPAALITDSAGLTGVIELAYRKNMFEFITKFDAYHDFSLFQYDFESEFRILPVKYFAMSFIVDIAKTSWSYEENYYFLVGLHYSTKTDSFVAGITQLARVVDL
jgi:hypothetical protein